MREAPPAGRRVRRDIPPPVGLEQGFELGPDRHGAGNPEDAGELPITELLLQVREFGDREWQVDGLDGNPLPPQGGHELVKELGIAILLWYLSGKPQHQEP